MMNVRMKEGAYELESLISLLNFGSKETPIKEYVKLVGEEIANAKYNMVQLVDLAWGREIHLGLDLNEEPIKGDDMND
jgi:hypothetical protein